MSSNTAAVAADGLPARLIKPHTLEKFDYHDRYCDIVSIGMPASWGGHVGYLELMAGSGIAMNAETADEIDASPLRAAGCSGFERLAFVEEDEALATALARRLRTRGHSTDRARVFLGDANDPDVLERALAFVGRGLLLSFIDPEDINHWWSTNVFLAERRRSIDFLITDLQSRRSPWPRFSAVGSATGRTIGSPASCASGGGRRAWGNPRLSARLDGLLYVAPIGQKLGASRSGAAFY